VGGVAEVRGADVVERGDDARRGIEEGLSLERGGRALRQVDLRDLGRLERHGDVDEELARERGADALEGGRVRGVRDREHDDLAGARRLVVAAAGDAVAGGALSFARAASREPRTTS
jgi:hypothetical protein